MAGFACRCMLGAALMFAGAAVAHGQSRGETSSPIVVTGRDVNRQIDEFVKALTPRPATNQFSRFEWSVCPVAIGLPGIQNAMVASRVRRVAKAARIRVAGSTCNPNVLVIVAPDKKAFMEDLGRRHRFLFGDMPGSRVRRLVREPGPATAWHVQGPALDADGVEVPLGEIAGHHAYVNRTTRPASRITAPARPHFAAAVVVVDAKSLAGLTTTQLADYAAMRLFAPADPARLTGPAPPTILTVLDAPMGSTVPITLSHWDLGFLRAYYSSPANLYASAQRSEVSRILRKKLKRSERAD